MASEVGIAAHEAAHKAGHIYYQCFGVGGPITEEQVAKAHSLGMFKQDVLEHRRIYAGHCRNASTAMWDDERKTFVILRRKFASVFAEDTPYPQVGYCYDVFVPTYLYERPTMPESGLDYITNKLLKENDDG